MNAASEADTRRFNTRNTDKNSHCVLGEASPSKRLNEDYSRDDERQRNQHPWQRIIRRRVLFETG